MELPILGFPFITFASAISTEPQCDKILLGQTANN
jgi:hypothetical protein